MIIYGWQFLLSLVIIIYLCSSKVPMPTRNINLTDHLDGFVESSIASGDYQNASEVIRDGLRLLQQRERENGLRLERLREASRSGFQALDEGPIGIGRILHDSMDIQGHIPMDYGET